MKQHITDPKTGISYTLHGDYYLPDLALPEPEPPVGRFGQAHAIYLRRHRKALYEELHQSGRLNAYVNEIDQQAQEMYDRLVQQYAKVQGVTEQLKAENQMEWVGRMNNIADAAREVVMNEIIYV